MSAQEAPAEGAAGRSTAYRIGRWIGPAVLLVVGAAGSIASLALGVTADGQPGPGLWPLIVSAVIAVCAIAMGPQDDIEPVRMREMRMVASAVLLLGLFSWLFTLLGVFFPTLIVLFVWLKLLSKRGWIFSAITALATAAALYVVFTFVFHVGA